MVGIFMSYVYDLVGNILEQRVGGDVGYPAVNIYSYDDLYRLAKVVSTSNKDEKDSYEQNYKYSPVGNIWYKSDQGDYSYPATTPTNGPSLNPEAVVSISLNNVVRKQFGYDLRGNVNAQKNFDESGKLLTDTSYTWDYRNRLTYGAVNDVALSKTSGYYFGYDYAGQRVLKSNADKSHVNYYPFEGFEEEVGTNGYKKTYAIAIGADETVKQMFSSEQNGGIFMASVREDDASTSPWLDWLNPPVEPQLPAVLDEIKERSETIDESEQTIEEHVVPDTTGQEPIAPAVVTQDEDLCKEIKLVSGMFYFYGDHLGSSSVVTDSTGKVVQTTDYYPYGGTHKEFTDPQFENDYLYTGKELDEELGIYYYGARYYMADVGRWMGEDPMVLYIGVVGFKDKYDKELKQLLSEPQELNVYAYVAGNPIRYVDPNGQSLADKCQELKEKYTEWKVDQNIKNQQDWIGLYNQVKGTPMDLGTDNFVDYKERSEQLMNTVIGSTESPRAVLKLGEGIYQIGSKIYANSDILTDIARKRGYDYSEMRQSIEQFGKSIQGGIKKVTKFVQDGEIKALVHEVTDYTGQLIHRDFDAIRNNAGQLIQKMNRAVKDKYDIQ